MLARGAHLACTLAQAPCSGSLHAARTTHSIQVYPLASYPLPADSLTPSLARRGKQKQRKKNNASWVELRTEPEADAAPVMLDPAKTIDS